MFGFGAARPRPPRGVLRSVAGGAVGPSRSHWRGGYRGVVGAARPIRRAAVSSRRRWPVRRSGGQPGHGHGALHRLVLTGCHSVGPVHRPTAPDDGDGGVEPPPRREVGVVGVRAKRSGPRSCASTARRDLFLFDGGGIVRTSRYRLSRRRSTDLLAGSPARRGPLPKELDHVAPRRVGQGLKHIDRHTTFSRCREPVSAYGPRRPVVSQRRAGPCRSCRAPSRRIHDAGRAGDRARRRAR